MAARPAVSSEGARHAALASDRARQRLSVLPHERDSFAVAQSPKRRMLVLDVEPL